MYGIASVKMALQQLEMASDLVDELDRCGTYAQDCATPCRYLRSSAAKEMRVRPR